jgi:hypothetical protein
MQVARERICFNSNLKLEVDGRGGSLVICFLMTVVETGCEKRALEDSNTNDLYKNASIAHYHDKKSMI